MILHPDGRVEGTPEELAQWKEAQARKQHDEWLKRLEHGSGGVRVIGRCPNEGHSCFCTGQCMGLQYTVEQRSYNYM